MKEHGKKPRQVGGKLNSRDQADDRRSSIAKHKETKATPDTETEMGKAEEMGERLKKPA